MNPRNTRGSRRALRRQSLAVELLESRELLACTVSPQVPEGTPAPDVSILCDQEADLVLLTPDGSGGLLVTIQETAEYRFEGVSRVQVATNGGSDRVFSSLVGDLIEPLTIDVLLGGGNDTFFMGGGVVVGETGERGTRPDPLVQSDLTVNVAAWSGNDFVSVNVGGVSGGNFRYRADLGSGSDEANVNLSDPLKAGATVFVDIGGNTGRDNLRALAFRCSCDGAIIDETSSLDVRLRGGPGNEAGFAAPAPANRKAVRRVPTPTSPGISILFEAEIDGSLNLVADGGTGDDNIRSEVFAQGSGHSVARARVEPNIRARVNGGLGNDLLTLRTSQSFPESRGRASQLKAVIDGDTGDDICVHPKDVVTISCDHDIVESAAVP